MTSQIHTMPLIPMRGMLVFPYMMIHLTITLQRAEELITEKQRQEQQRHIKTFGEGDEKIDILNGRYGPYIAYGGKNYRIPKAMHERVAVNKRRIPGFLQYPPP